MAGGEVVTFGSLFAGIGGMDLGLERAGMECRWQVEIDPFCQKVLTKHWPEVPKYGDIRKLNGSELERVDCIAGGFPCQPVSKAGQRRKQSDERWLWPEFLRLIGVVRPRVVIVENVSGLLTGGMGDVLGGLAAFGYDAEWDCIPAASVGAPHIRDRVWILAYSGQEPWSDERRNNGQRRRHYLLPEGNDRDPSVRRNDWELVALVPGVHPGVASDWWARQSSVARTVNGLPRKLVDDRTGACGNAVVPQVAEWIGRRIMEAS
jgi:DNA (cytosine-5)-methyltransferase 1